MITEKNCKSIKDILNNDIQTNGIVFSPIFGELEYLGEDNGLTFRCLKSNSMVTFREDGTYAEGGDVLLFPSNENRKWEDVPIRYPNSKIELLAMLCKKQDTSLSKLEENKQRNIYYYLIRFCRFLDSLAVDLDKMHSYKEWVVYPVYNENDFLRNRIIWKVKKRNDLFFHFGFFTKTAAEKFIELLEDDIETWRKNVYSIDYVKTDFDLFSFNYSKQLLSGKQ